MSELLRSMVLCTPVLDQILENTKNDLGRDFTAYRNHCYRVLNFCLALGDAEHDDEILQKVSIAVAFHDLGIWTDKTFDYLEPSKKLVQNYLEKNNLSGWKAEIRMMIEFHHKMTPYTGLPNWLVEPFRKADWIDVSLGWLKFGLSDDFVTEVRGTFPNAGFHKRLTELTWQQFKQTPRRPLPMMRW